MWWADFDLCTACISHPAKRETHPLAHVFFPIPEPGVMGAFNRALLERVRVASGQLSS